MANEIHRFQFVILKSYMFSVLSCKFYRQLNLFLDSLRQKHLKVKIARGTESGKLSVAAFYSWKQMKGPYLLQLIQYKMSRIID
jgi:hypothetical protein